MKRICNALAKLNWEKARAVFVLCAATAMSLPAQTLTTLHSFYGKGGEDPWAGLVQAINGDLYGTTVNYGANGEGGTVFKITPSGLLKTLYSFCAQSGCTNGSNPYAELVQASNGYFYGTTVNYGANGEGGTVFKITPSGTLTTLYSFCAQSGCTDGAYPNGLVQATNADLYGTTSSGGASSNCFNGITGCGTVFKITPSGTLTTLYSFCAQSGCTDGEDPVAALVQAANGDLYGTTIGGGTNNSCSVLGCGTAFKITPGGTLTTLYSFCSQGGSACTDGYDPYWGL